jgi:toxin ParE1/3/4
MEGRLKPGVKARLRWTERALQNLEAALEYVAEDSPQAALNLARRVYSGIEALGHHPELGRPGRCKGTRELVLPGTPYIIPYRVKDGAVEILTVLHGSRKWPVKL